MAIRRCDNCGHDQHDDYSGGSAKCPKCKCKHYVSVRAVIRKVRKTHKQ